MSVLTSLRTGASGLAAHGEAIGVVGDNIANVSTVGFKSGQARFQDVLGGSAPNGQRLGAGVRLAGVDSSFNQGPSLQTGGSLDLAIRGDGFFVVKGNHDGADGTYYTRDGRFKLDEEGYLVNQNDLKVQGYTISDAGQTGATAGDLRIGGISAPVATGNVELKVNLSSDAQPPAGAFDPASADATSNHATSFTVHDSVGAEHRVDVFFRNTSPGNWEWHALVDGGELTGGTAGQLTSIANGTLTFNAGRLDTETTAASSADFVGATPGQVINFDFGDSITTDGGTGEGGSTQFAGDFNPFGFSHDGFGSGSLVDVNVTNDGTITGVFSNGQTRSLAKVALGAFQNEQGLLRAGNQLYAETPDSGQALVGAPATGNRGGISAGTLESSNVDIANELITLIAYQRAFQANARTITTADEMLAEVSALKR